MSDDTTKCWNNCGATILPRTDFKVWLGRDLFGYSCYDCLGSVVTGALDAGSPEYRVEVTSAKDED